MIFYNILKSHGVYRTIKSVFLSIYLRSNRWLSIISRDLHRDLTMQIGCVNHCKGWFGKYLHWRPYWRHPYWKTFQSPSRDLRAPEAEHVCLQLSISKECLVWVSTHHLPLETPSGCRLDDVFQPDPYCSAAQTSLLCGARGSRSFVRDGKKEKRCGGVQCLGALQIIKVSCFSPIHSPPLLLVSCETALL